MGEARPLNLLNIAVWLIYACLHPSPFCLRLGDRVLAPCVLTPYVYMQRQSQETSKKSNSKKKMQGAYERGIKHDKHDRHGKHSVWQKT